MAPAAAVAVAATLSGGAMAADLGARSITQYSPYAEWELTNASIEGNPFDVVATVTFVHAESGEQRKAAMFFDGGQSYKFRFTGRRTGTWTFTTESSDADLAGHIGSVVVEANPNPSAQGFVRNFGNKWGFEGSERATVPQYVMYGNPSAFFDKPSKIDADIAEFFDGHGFNGFHVPSVAGRWFDMTKSDNAVDSSLLNPDPRTFRALELLITKTHAVSGIVHIWVWGDAERGQVPDNLSGGVNGPVDRRLQRYIAARLGPLPGWTMGYGFDLFEWTTGSKLDDWHTFMSAELCFPHLLGARASTNQLNQFSENLDYSSYEQHRPDYAKYVETIEKRPTKPSFSEDRFRIRDEGRTKDYSDADTRRGLWHSTMAGGVANIWGNLINSPSDGSSAPYPNKAHLKTYGEFFFGKGRFLRAFERAPGITDGVALKTPDSTAFVFYREDAASVRLDLSAMPASMRAIAIDAKAAYVELDLGILEPKVHEWTAPHLSDWALAVGEFVETSSPAPGTGGSGSGGSTANAGTGGTNGSPTGAAGSGTGGADTGTCGEDGCSPDDGSSYADDGDGDRATGCACRATPARGHGTGVLLAALLPLLWRRRA
jgi:hypothetical protein